LQIANRPEHLIAYSGGPKTGENVGAGVVIMQHGRPDRETSYPMGDEVEVYDAELLGILEAAKQLVTTARRMEIKLEQAWIFTDN
jgi:hypothetical protein